MFQRMAMAMAVVSSLVGDEGLIGAIVGNAKADCQATVNMRRVNQMMSEMR